MDDGEVGERFPALSYLRTTAGLLGFFFSLFLQGVPTSRKIGLLHPPAQTDMTVGFGSVRVLSELGGDLFSVHGWWEACPGEACFRIRPETEGHGQKERFDLLGKGSLIAKQYKLRFV